MPDSPDNARTYSKTSKRPFLLRRSVVVFILTVGAALDAVPDSWSDGVGLERSREPVERKGHSWKTKWPREGRRDQTLEMVRKEIWVHLLVSKAVRKWMVAAAWARNWRPDQVTFPGAWQTGKAFRKHLQKAGTVTEK